MPSTRIDGADLYYEQSGTGPVALFVHGFPLDHTMWDAQREALADLCTCVAHDLRGFGASQLAGDLTMERHARDAVAILDAVGADQADVVGLSMGGYAALALWELFPARVRSLTLVDTRAADDDEAGKAKRDAGAARLVEEGREAFSAGMLPALLGPDASVPVRAHMREMLESASYPAIVRALEGMKVRPDRRGLLSTIDVPALVVCGEHDTLTPPEESRAMAEAIPGARLEIIPRSGHMSPLENAPAVNRALREFWT